MHRLLKRFYLRAVQAMEISYRLARGIDYKTLSEHILSIHQLKDIDSILYKSARCLKDILDYRLFAFAMRDGEAVDIWLDPKLRSDNPAILDVIKSDLCVTGDNYILHHFDDEAAEARGIGFPQLDNLRSYRVLDDGFTARMYLLPNRKFMPYHHDIIDTIVKVVGTSLATFMSIKSLQDAALIDPLTLCYNRRALDELIDRTIAGTRRYGTDLSAIMFDLDNFKRVNDTHGHQVGDHVLQAVSRTVLAAIRKSDYLIRYGGEEFVLIMPETKLGRAVEVADRLRRIIEISAIQYGGVRIHVTASFGVADLKRDYDRNLLLQEADRRLYEAKVRGRNRTSPDVQLLLFDTVPMPEPAYQYLN
ncbi:MAG: sensor domain-containing diguanylate cyclase [Syntrophales bacterium]